MMLRLVQPASMMLSSLVVGGNPSLPSERTRFIGNTVDAASTSRSNRNRYGGTSTIVSALMSTAWCAGATPSGRHPLLETQSGPTTTGPSEVVAPVLSVFSASSGRPEERDDERTRED